MFENLLLSAIAFRASIHHPPTLQRLVGARARLGRCHFTETNNPQEFISAKELMQAKSK
jgi:hypothetical protein